MSDVIRAEGRDTTYETALELHEAIMHSAQAAALSLMEMCRGLKKMRDTRLYESLGHSSFDDYCEKMAGIRARQAYTYIAVYERFGEARLAANASLGVTKLELISRLPFSEQDSVLEAAGLEGMSVAELRAMAEQYRTVGHQTDMFAAAEASEISEGLREKLKNADGQYATLKVYFAAIRENFVRAAELIGTFDGGDREKYTAAFVKLLDALREEITEK